MLTIQHVRAKAEIKGYTLSRGITSMWLVACGWDSRPCNNLSEAISLIRNLPSLIQPPSLASYKNLISNERK